MIIHDVQVPQTILDAIENNTLAIFAGAGVSMGEPANLPSFWQLAEALGKPFNESPRCLGKDLSGGDIHEPLDQFLGRLHLDDKILRQRSAALLDPGMQHTALHSSLLKLFRRPEGVRLVTTNFDTLFESALKVWEPEWQKVTSLYTAPALPLGSDFNGIVHVHGAINPTDSIVLTDRDFGRAYLTEGWARRFLVDLFQTYTVLFVGYSHDDTVMQYLARSLPDKAEGKRYVLAGSDEDKEKWAVLGITPMVFSKDHSQDFQSLYGFAQELAEQSSLKPSDWKGRITLWGQQTPDLLSTNDEQSLLSTLQDISKLRYFCEAASSPKWLVWLRRHCVLNDLFDAQKQTEKTRVLFEWVVRKYSVDYSDEVYKLFELNNGVLPHWQWFEMGRHLGNTEVEKLILCRWIDVLLQLKPEGVDQTPVIWLAKQCSQHEAWGSLLLLFESLAASRVGLIPSGIRSKQQFREIVIETETYNINDVWENHIRPNLDVLVDELFPLCVRLLERRQQLFVAWSKGYQFDSEEREDIAFGRDGDMADPIDVLINVAVACVELQARVQFSQMIAWIERSQSSGSEVIRRIAVHAVEHLSKLSASEKLALLMTVGFSKGDCFIELYRIIRELYLEFNSDDKKDVMVCISGLQSPWDAGDGELNGQRQMSWLTGLREVEPECEHIRDYISLLLKQFPNLREEAYQPFVQGVFNASRKESNSPFSLEEILAKSDFEHFNKIVQYLPTDGNFACLDKLEGLLHTALSQDMNWLKKFVGYLQDHTTVKNRCWDIVLKRFACWEANEGIEGLIMATISKPELYIAQPCPVSNILLSYCKLDSDCRPLLLEMDTVADRLWQECQPSEHPKVLSPTVPWIATLTLNYEVSLASYWLKRLKVGVDSTQALFCLSRLTLMLDCSQQRTQVTIPTIFRGSAFLCDKYPDFFKKKMEPLLRHESNDRAEQAWSGMLHGRVLTLPLYAHTQDSLKDLLPNYQHVIRDKKGSFLDWLAFIIFEYSGESAVRWLPLTLQHLTLGDRRDFIIKLGKRMKEVRYHADWKAWIAPFWKDRISNIPIETDAIELMNMFAWLPKLQHVFEEAVDVAVSMTKHPLPRGAVLYDFFCKDLHKNFPEAMCKVIVHMLKCDHEYHHFYQLDEMLTDIDWMNVSLDVQAELREALVEASFKEQALIPLPQVEVMG